MAVLIVFLMLVACNVMAGQQIEAAGVPEPWDLLIRFALAIVAGVSFGLALKQKDE